MSLSAVIIDTRGGRAFVYVVNNIIANIPKATVVWFHGPETNVEETLKSIVDARRVKLKLMKFDPPFSIATYNAMVTKAPFYECLHENILIFQPDSCFESLSLHSMKEFYKFDYVGAPWENNPEWPWHNHVGNGGFTFRKRSAMLKCIREIPYRGENEDVYFSFMCKGIINVAPVEVGRRFSYEITKPYPGSIGFHKVWAYMKPGTTASKELCELQNLP